MNLNEPAPDFSLPDLQGRWHRLSDYRGRLLILNFWSAACPHCVRTDLVIESIASEADGRLMVAAIAPNRSETMAEIEQAAQRRGLSLVLRDSYQKVADLYDAQATPHVFLLDGEGLVRYRGAVDDVRASGTGTPRSYLEEAVAALLEGRLPAVQETPAFGCAIIRYI